MLDLTLALIVKNEEKHLPACLESFSGLWKELLIVDTGSSDNTKDIASKHNARILDFQWIDDFSAARNFTLEQVKTDWVMMIDADDMIDTTDKQLLLEELQTTVPKYDLTIMPYHYSGERHNPQIMLYLPKIWKTKLGLRYKRPIHEYLNYSTKQSFQKSEIPILHKKIPSEANSYERNTRLLKKATQTDPDDTANYLYLGKEFQNQKELDQAIQNYLIFLDKKPAKATEISYVQNNLGICHLLQGNLGQAKKHFQKAINSHPQFIDPYLYLAEIEMNTNSISNAIQLLNKAKTLTTPHTNLPFNKNLYQGMAEQLLHKALNNLNFTR